MIGDVVQLKQSAVFDLICFCMDRFLGVVSRWVADDLLGSTAQEAVFADDLIPKTYAPPKHLSTLTHKMLTFPTLKQRDLQQE